jgi:hypothetical protein
LGFKALYKATSGAANVDETAIEETVKPAEAENKAKSTDAPAADIVREKVEVPPLYVD